MRKFLILVQKEISELLTLQMLIPFVVMMIVFTFIGEIIGEEREKQMESMEIAVMDQDQSSLTDSVIKLLEESNFTVIESQSDSVAELLDTLKSGDVSMLLVFPEGFEQGILNAELQQVKVYSILRSFTLTSNIGSGNLEQIMTVVRENLSTQLIQDQLKDVDPAFLKRPVSSDNYVILGDKQSNVNPATVVGFISSQTAIIPIILFLVITVASQLVATAIAAEKENKTLEILLSSPINRKAIVAAKLLGAGIISLLMAVVYLFGMQSYMGGLMGDSLTQGADSEIASSISELGLEFTTSGYLLLGSSLFLGILAALSFTFILGSFARDTRTAQSVIAPVMVSLLIPYLLTMLMDISSLSPVLRFLIYAIPFTHTFVAAPNILMDKYILVVYGNLYLLVVVIVGIYLASKLFSSEKILTMRLSFGKKK